MVFSRLAGVFRRYRDARQDAGLQDGAFVLRVRFGLAVMRLVPHILAWKAFGNPRHLMRIKQGLGLAHTAAGLPLSGPVFADPADRAAGGGQIVIVLPVHDAHDVLCECLDRLERHTDLEWRLIAVEDASPDPRIRPLLRSWAERMNAGRPGQVQLIECATNLGFVGAANLGLAAALQAGGQVPVILLNSDALVPPGWASRLVAPLLRDPEAASVTPMTNDGEIFSVPGICAGQALRPGQVDAIDAWARKLSSAIAVAQTPTGVGFCMAMSPRFLRKVPAFDAAFGRGYGEEVDWCQKTAALGGRHLGLASLFVEHRGAESFGQDTKGALIAEHNRIISRRYPGYDLAVQKFIRNDPLVTARMALGLAWAGTLGEAGEGVPVWLAHSLGGGAEHWLQAQIAAAALPSVVLRVGGAAQWQIELYPGGRAEPAIVGRSDAFGLVKDLLEVLPRRRIVYSCAVGAADPLRIPDRLLELVRPGQDRLEVLLHDYLPLSPSYTLLDENGAYRGAPPEMENDAEWRLHWGRLLKAADEIRAFSRSSHDLFAGSWPELRDRLSVVPHALLAPVAPVAPPPDSAPMVLGIPGNLAAHKGAGVVCELARRLARSGRAKMVFLGQMAPEFSLPGNVLAHGPYRREDLSALAEQYGITHWLIPSVWPETFSFTTHEALATGLPVLAFDIGAQGEAVSAAPNGYALAYAPGADLAGRIETALEVLA